MGTRARARVAGAALGFMLWWCATATAQMAVPNRPGKPLFRGVQGEQHSSEVAFDPATRGVTVKVSVQDPNGYFISSLRRENFAVIEDGVPQRSATVEIEHAPITLAVLIQAGGRSQPLNKVLQLEAPFLTRPLMDTLAPNDKLAIFTYDDTVHSLINFDTAHDRWDAAINSLQAAPFSEANLYDAALQVLNRMRTVQGRKALLLITTGIDTFRVPVWDG